MIRRHPLDHGWTVEPRLGSEVPADVAAAGRIPATVPGVVHTDLLAAGLIGDPYHGSNERLQEWIGRTGWRFRTVFDAPEEAEERTDLVFSGLDTVATAMLNGVVILKSRNQHRSYRVDVARLLRPRGNELVVDFDAPVPYADRMSLELGYRPHVNHHPYNAVRKMACSFGWDWGIDTSTSGIWRPVALESWSTARLATVRSVASLADRDGVVDVIVAIDRATDAPLELRASIAGAVASVTVPAGESSAALRLEVPDAKLWWPRGYGEQHRYDLLVELLAGGEAVDTAARRIGFRTVELDTAPDAAGTPFTVVVNGRAVFVKGVNWIPDDAFPHRVDRARYAHRLDQAAAANVNLIRVWGGGIYESDDFYELADERGLLVWQDFLLACAAYAEEEPLRSEIEAEAREAVTRLGSHPSLVILNGNNENLWGYEEWNWQPRLEGRTWGAYYYHELFPAIVAELAPHVAYTPGSPFSPDPDRPANAEQHGTMHIWDLWNEKDYPRYRDYRPRFVSEFGWQGPPAWSTLVGALDDDPLTPESPGMLVHQKAMEGNVKLVDGLVPHFPLPNTMPEWHWAMQLNQARAIRTAIEHFRSLAPHCQGAIVWQLNDCWPVVSWAAVDGAGREKPLWYAIRAAYAPRLLTVQPDGAGLVLAVVNDTDEAWHGTAVVDRRSLDGELLASAGLGVALAPRETVRLAIPSEVATAGDPTAELLRARLDETTAEWFFAEDRELGLGAAEFDVSAAPVEDGALVTVTARTLVRDLALLADVVDPAARVDDALVTLLPGETARLRVHSAADPARFTAAPVLRTANELLEVLR